MSLCTPSYCSCASFFGECRVVRVAVLPPAHPSRRQCSADGRRKRRASAEERYPLIRFTPFSRGRFICPRAPASKAYRPCQPAMLYLRDYGFQHTPSLSVNQYTRTPTLATITCRQLYHTTRRAQGRVSTYTRYCVNYMQHSGVVCCVLITPHSVSSQAGAPPPRRLLFKSLIYCERVRLAIVRRANAILLEHQANALLND